MLLESLGCFPEVLGNLSRATGPKPGVLSSPGICSRNLSFPQVHPWKYELFKTHLMTFFLLDLFFHLSPTATFSNFRDSQLLSLKSWTDSTLLPAREPMCLKHGHVRVRSTRPGWTLCSSRSSLSKTCPHSMAVASTSHLQG